MACIQRHFVFSNVFVRQNYDFPNNLEDYVHRIGRTGVSVFGLGANHCYIEYLYSELVNKGQRTLSSQLRTLGLHASLSIFFERPKPRYLMNSRKWLVLAGAVVAEVCLINDYSLATCSISTFFFRKGCWSGQRWTWNWWRKSFWRGWFQSRLWRSLVDDTLLQLLHMLRFIVESRHAVNILRCLFVCRIEE